jgi:hypothetical protein
MLFFAVSHEDPPLATQVMPPAVALARTENPSLVAPTAIEEPQARSERELQTLKPTAGDSALEVLVVSADNVPVAGARFVVFRGEEILADKTCDEQGSARLSAATGSADVAVFAAGWPLTRSTIELNAGQQRVILPEGAVLGGWVLVEGATPSEAIELQFEASRIAPDAAGMPRAVNALLLPMLFEHGNH